MQRGLRKDMDEGTMFLNLLPLGGGEVPEGGAHV